MNLRGSYDRFPDFFSYGHFYGSYIHETLVPFEVISFGCNALVVPFYESPLVWACQRSSLQPLPSPQLSHNDSLWALGISKSYWEQALDYRKGEELSCLVYWLPYSSHTSHHPSQTPCLTWISFATQKLMLDSRKMLQKHSKAFHTFLWHFFSKFKTQFYCILFF